MNWLLWWALAWDRDRRADGVRAAGLDQLRDGSFAEYYEPFSGEPLGSRDQSWSAAVALAWLLGELR